MNIYQYIQSKMKKMRDLGMTQAEMAKYTGISQPYISQLMNPKDGVKRISHLELGKFFKLFPHARIDFGDGETGEGGRSVRNCQLNHSQVVTGDGSVVTAPQPQGESADELLRRIMSSDELDAETKVKIYGIATRRP